MSNGLGGNITVNHKRRPPGAPFAPTSADNGLSVDGVSGKIVLGDDPGGVLSTLLNSREIQLNGNFISFIGTSNFSQIDISEFVLAARMGQGLPNQGGFQVSDTTYQLSLSTFAPQASSQLQATNLLWDLLMANVTAAFTARLTLDTSTPSILLELFDGFTTASLRLSSAGVQLGDINNQSQFLKIEIDNVADFVRMSARDAVSASFPFFNYDGPTAILGLGDPNGNMSNCFVLVDNGNNRIDLNAAALRMNGTLGFSGTVAAPASITVVNGIVTNVT